VDSSTRELGTRSQRKCSLDSIKTHYPVGLPHVGEEEIQCVVAALRAGQLTQGPNVRLFEERFAEYLGAEYAVACSSGTAALHLAFASLGIGPGDEVLVPDVTYVATANAVSYTGASPVLVDVDADTWCISLQDAEQKVSAMTRAILPVHLYGVPCDMGAMHEFAVRYDIDIIEDAAEALGGSWDGHACGTMGLAGTFSFYANKVLTTGEGGAVVTDDVDFAETLRRLRGQAQSPIRRFWHGELGFNYRLSDIHAAIGLAQLERLPCALERRQHIVEHYRDRLRHVLLSPENEGTAPWLYTALLPSNVSYNVVQTRLARHDIEVRPIFVPMHRLPMYARPDKQFPVSCQVADYGISLPTYPELTVDDVRFISDAVLEALQ